VFGGHDYEHVVHLSARARQVERSFGGAALTNYANVPIGQFNAPVTAPTWLYGVQSEEAIRQFTGSFSYLLARRGLGNVGLGVQQIYYRKTLANPGRPNSVAIDKPLFWNGSASLTPTRRIALYAAFTKGLEEAPVAPEVATNAQEAPPAIRTKQTEFGVRYIVTPHLRFVLGYFNVQKPYFNLDPARTWRELGVERHAGIEASLTGEIRPGFNVVAGFVHMKPRVTGEAVNLGLIGPVPIGQPRDNGRLNFDYRLRPTSPVSFEGAINYFGSRPVSSRVFAQLNGKQLEAEDYMTLDLGMRYRFVTDGHRSTLRLQAINIFDAQRWVVATTGGMTINPPRRYAVSLATDF
jgi:iron complex outermembrane receptor protein